MNQTVAGQKVSFRRRSAIHQSLDISVPDVVESYENNRSRHEESKEIVPNPNRQLITANLHSIASQKKVVEQNESVNTFGYINDEEEGEGTPSRIVDIAATLRQKTPMISTKLKQRLEDAEITISLTQKEKEEAMQKAKEKSFELEESKGNEQFLIE